MLRKARLIKRTAGPSPTAEQYDLRKSRARKPNDGPCFHERSQRNNTTNSTTNHPEVQGLGPVREDGSAAKSLNGQTTIIIADQKCEGVLPEINSCTGELEIVTHILWCQLTFEFRLRFGSPRGMLYNTGRVSQFKRIEEEMCQYVVK